MPVFPDEEYQRIRSNLLFPPELDLSPKQTRELFLDNIFRRSLSLITGLSLTGEKVLVATPAGILKVATTGAGFDTYEAHQKLGQNDWEITAGLEPAGLSSRWDIIVQNYPCRIHFRNVGDTGYGDDIYLLIGAYSIDIVSKKVQWKNMGADEQTLVYVVAYR